jgi:transposase-like protein
MSTHFLLQAKARTLSIRDIYAGGEDKAFDLFCQLRWPETDGAPVCPKCGCAEVYKITTRRKFKCKSPACHHQFSPTSGTIFASRKMTYVDLLAAIAIVTNGAKGVSALQLARDLDCNPKTAWVMAHKLREALAAEVNAHKLNGEVEIDGAYFGGHIRPANRADDRVDRRLSEHQTGKRRVVVALRQRKGRTLTFVVKQEADGVALVPNVVDPGSVVHADEASHWDALHGFYETHRINHSEAYSLDGICTNQAESYFSRLRRMVTGQHHGVSAQHLHAYASHAAWMEDHRRMDNGALAKRALRLTLIHPVSRTWKGRWQRAVS